jgi:peptide/nickel transport system substrate-binding protein
VDQKAGKQEIKLDLAESWKQVDPTTLEFKLKQGVKFHDGSDFDAATAKWSLDRMSGNAKSLSKQLATNIASIEAPDKSTLRIKYKSASALQLPNLTPNTGGTGCNGPMFLSKTQADKEGEAAIDSRPVGTGPFKVTDWKRDSEITLAKFDSYWKKGADGQALPYVDGLKSRLISDNAVVLMELKAGSIHYSRYLTASDIPSVKSTPDLEIGIVDWAAPANYFGFNREKSPFGTNRKLRLGAQYAMDKESMAKVMAPGIGIPNKFLGWVPSWSGYSESLPTYPYDVSKGTELVKEAGFPNGVNIVLLHESPTASRKAAEIVQSMFAKVGINATLEPMEKVAARQRIVKGDFEMHIWGWSPSPDPAHYNRAWTCEGSANWGHYCNPELDKCMFEGEAEMDTAKRSAIYARCYKTMYEDAMQSGTFISPRVVVTRKEMKGLRYDMDHNYLGEVWLDK